MACWVLAELPDEGLGAFGLIRVQQAVQSAVVHHQGAAFAQAESQVLGFALLGRRLLKQLFVDCFDGYRTRYFHLLFQAE
ncbi:hypothetical protein DB032_16140 [Chromobacterium sp. Panama]|uniref:hypothetical protein n=1 Tax=Chromobacterium sp. Panama TaxID=2161826 RepID=UPI000D2FD92E|nr:hypothetical protein [Chromobacterium sp. Panama]PTU66347.1 hypothetical protein DB032_16140 [Chromobacterium sp. Panama]